MSSIAITILFTINNAGFLGIRKLGTALAPLDVWGTSANEGIRLQTDGGASNRFKIYVDNSTEEIYFNSSNAFLDNHF